MAGGAGDYIEGDGLDSVWEPNQNTLKRGLPNSGPKLKKRWSRHVEPFLFTKRGAT